MSCTNINCDGDGLLRDGPWGNNAPCPTCTGATGPTLEDLQKLEAALDAGGYNSGPPSSATLTVVSVDTDPWVEFSDGFFDRPLSKSTLFQTIDQDNRNLVLPCAFLSAVSVSREKAIAELRRDLVNLDVADVQIKAYLAKPSTLELRVPVRPGESSDCEIVVDLRGGVPGKKKYAAFCFIHGYRESITGPEALSLEVLAELGIKTATLEGMVGSEVEEDLPEFEIDVYDEDQELLYPNQTPPKSEVLLLKEKGKNEVLITGVQDPVETLVDMYPELKVAAKKHGINLKGPAGNELTEMRKFFGHGSGLYLVSVNFQTARTEAHLLNEEAQQKIHKALSAKPKKAKVKTNRNRKPAKKPIKRKR